MPGKNITKYSTSFFTRKLQIKTLMRYHLYPVKWLKFKMTGTLKDDKEEEKWELSYMIGENIKW